MSVWSGSLNIQYNTRDSSGPEIMQKKNTKITRLRTSSMYYIKKQNNYQNDKKKLGKSKANI